MGIPLFALQPLHVNLGAQLIGCFINLVLYTIELMAGWRYFHGDRRKRDHKILVGIVIHNLVMDTIGTFAVCADVFVALVVCWGDFSRLATRNQWALFLLFLTTGLVGLTVQCFMVFRYWKISSNYYISILLLVMILFTLAVSLHLTVILMSNKLDLNNLSRRGILLMALIAAVVTDISINLALISYLHKVRTPVIATRHIIQKITTLAIITGCATSLVAVAMMVSVLVHPLSPISNGIGSFIARAYSLTLLYTLLNRDKMGQDPWLHVIVDTESTPSLTSQTPSLPTTQERTMTPSDVMTFAPHQDQDDISFHNHPRSKPDFRSEHTMNRTLSGHSIPYPPSQREHT